MTARARRHRRGRWARFPTGGQLAPPPVPVPQVGPLVFSLRLDGRELRVDWSDLPCPKLARPIVQALRDLAGEEGRVRSVGGFRHLLRSVRSFVVFVAAEARQRRRAEHLGLADLTADHLDGFEQALLRQHGPDSPRPNAVLKNVTRVLRAVHEARPQEFRPETAARIRYAARTATTSTGRPLDAYPPAVFAAIKQAALGDVRAIQQRILDGERLAAAGQDPEIAGWGPRPTSCGTSPTADRWSMRITGGSPCGGWTGSASSTAACCSPPRTWCRS